MEITHFRHDGMTEVFTVEGSTDDVGCSMEITMSTYRPNEVKPDEVHTFKYEQSYEDDYYAYNAAENFEAQVQNEPEITERMIDAIKLGMEYHVTFDDMDDDAVSITTHTIG